MALVLSFSRLVAAEAAAGEEEVVVHQAEAASVVLVVAALVAVAVAVAGKIFLIKLHIPVFYRDFFLRFPSMVKGLAPKKCNKYCLTAILFKFLS